LCKIMTKDDVFRRTAAFISSIHTLEASLEHLITDEEFSSLQLNLMRILYFSSPRSLSSLSACVNMNLPNTSREIRRLTEAGVVCKSVSSRDKRITELSLTESGKKKVEEGLEVMKNCLFSSSGEWTEDRMMKYLESLSVIESELFSNPQ